MDIIIKVRMLNYSYDKTDHLKVEYNFEFY